MLKPMRFIHCHVSRRTFCGQGIEGKRKQGTEAFPCSLFDDTACRQFISGGDGAGRDGAW